MGFLFLKTIFTTQESMRNTRLDTLKGILILLVVFGHFIETLIDSSQIFKTLYLFIYSFHIPLFVGISGYVTSTVSPKKSIPIIAATLLLFTVLYELFELGTTGNFSKYPFIVVPNWIMWYLYSLVCWRFTIPLIRSKSVSLIISITISLIMGYTPLVGYALGLSRTLFFSPFFLLGYILKEKKELRHFRISGPIALVSLITILAFLSTCVHVNEEWFYGSYHYTHFTNSFWNGLGTRLGIYCLSIWSSWSLLSLANYCIVPLQKIGERSLTVYVWHGFIVKTVVQMGGVAAIYQLPPLISLITILMLSIFVTVTLSSQHLHSFTQRAINLFLTFLTFLRPCTPVKGDES